MIIHKTIKNSSFIKKISFFNKGLSNGSIIIKMTSGNYQYYDVDIKTANDFIKSPSKGISYNKLIKNKFLCEKVT